MPKIVKIDNARAKRLWQGETMKTNAIAALFNVEPRTLRRHARRHGWGPRPESTIGRRLTWDAAEARVLWDRDDLTVRQIADRLNVPPETLHSYASYHDWPRKGAPIVRRVQPSAPTAPAEEDSDIARFRAEKAARVKLGPADDFAEARLQLLHLEAAAKPKRGRPKKSAAVPMEDAA